MRLRIMDFAHLPDGQGVRGTQAGIVDSWMPLRLDLCSMPNIVGGLRKRNEDQFEIEFEENNRKKLEAKTR